MYKVLLRLLVCGLVFNVLACNRTPTHLISPSQRLSEYISRSFSVKETSDKATLLSYLTGDAKARLERWSDDQFQEAFLDSKKTFLKLSLKEVKEISKDEAQITYELSYSEKGNKGGKPHEAKILNKKLCRMLQENGKWYIAEVKNMKQLIEYQDELSLP